MPACFPSEVGTQMMSEHAGKSVWYEMVLQIFWPLHSPPAIFLFSWNRGVTTATNVCMWHILLSFSTHYPPLEHMNQPYSFLWCSLSLTPSNPAGALPYDPSAEQESAMFTKAVACTYQFPPGGHSCGNYPPECWVLDLGVTGIQSYISSLHRQGNFPPVHCRRSQIKVIMHLISFSVLWELENICKIPIMMTGVCLEYTA